MAQSSVEINTLKYCSLTGRHILGILDMQPKWRLAQYSLALVLLVSLTAHSDIRTPGAPIGKVDLSSDMIFIEGEITENDAVALDWIMAMRAKSKTPVPELNLNSDGGSLVAAMRIGRTARKYQMRAGLWNREGTHGRCQSACVFVLAGAISRVAIWQKLNESDPDTIIGIHRPYPTDVEERTVVTADRLYKDLAKRVRDYFDEMNMPPTLAEAILKVPPGQGRVLSETEARAYMLVGQDPVAEELRTAQEARKFGLSRQEYMRRDSRASKECQLGDSPGEDDWLVCIEKTLAGKR